MLGKSLLSAVLVLCVSAPIFAADEEVQVSIKGVLQEDKNGFFIKANGTIFDLYFDEKNTADMRKFYTTIEGDMVKVSGNLNIREDKGKMFNVVYANDITRLKGERVVVRQAEPVPVPVPQTVVVRERYVERDRGIRLPGIRIGW